MSSVPETGAENLPHHDLETEDVCEMAAQYAGHPAASEVAAEMRSKAQGLRPTCTDRLPVPTRPVQVPTHNARVRQFLAMRQAEWAKQGHRLIVAEPERLAFRSLLGARRTSFGYALNLEYVYFSPRGCEYVLTGCVMGIKDGRLTGQSYARECSCPDFQARRGPARDQVRGEARCCKHMRLFMAVAYLWRGQLPWVGGVPAEHQLSGEGWVLREF